MTTCTTTEEEEEEDCCPLLLLPDDITIEILSRLPAKSVEQCKCVCKRWRAVIADPAFINSHHLKAPIEWVTFWYNKQEKAGMSFNHQLYYGEYNDDNINPPFKHNQPVNYRPSTARYHNPRKQTTVCSCNGLIFSMSIYADTMFVSNPFTREYVNLPRPLGFHAQFLSYLRHRQISLASGFGYNSYTNEYKIVIIHAGYSFSLPGYVTIYTLGSGRWRDVEKTSPKLIKGTNNRGVFLNGALHWLTENKEIVSFDLADELFRIVPSPPLPLLHSVDDDYVPQLGLLRGCLYVTRKRTAGAQSSTVLLDIWVMENNNNEVQVQVQSWTRKFSISWKLAGDDLSADGYKPLALSKSGKLILFHNDGYDKPLVSYDPGTQTSIVDDSFPKGSGDIYVIRYVKSFLSLHTLGETINVVSSLPTLGETRDEVETKVD